MGYGDALLDMQNCVRLEFISCIVGDFTVSKT